MQLWEERALAKQEAREDGISTGESKKLIEQICKKLRKGLMSEEIAELLEEDLSTVQEICEAAASYAPNYEEEKVLSAYLKKNNQ